MDADDGVALVGRTAEHPLEFGLAELGCDAVSLSCRVADHRLVVLDDAELEVFGDVLDVALERPPARAPGASLPSERDRRIGCGAGTSTVATHPVDHCDHDGSLVDVGIQPDGSRHLAGDDRACDAEGIFELPMASTSRGSKPDADTCAHRAILQN